jgi:hypothetical protein
MLVAQGGGEAALLGWYLGFGIGAAVVLIVVVVVTWILVSAAAIRREADRATLALREVHRTTLPLWRVRDVNDEVLRLHEQTQTARGALEQGA